jgi:hypothetical protein
LYAAIRHDFSWNGCAAGAHCLKNAAIATGVATTHLGPANFTSVVSAPIISSTSAEALQVTIALARGFAASVTGEIAASTFYDMNKRLQAAGEDRFTNC